MKILTKKMPFTKLSLQNLNRLSVSEFKQTEKLPLVLVLDNIRSALNVGSIFRTCDAFALEKLLLCGITAQPPHREITKTALGSNETVAWEYFENTTAAIQKLKENNFLVVGIEQVVESIFLDDTIFLTQQNKPLALVLGNEVDGISDEALALCDYVVEIKQFGTKHSINVAVTAGIVAWFFSHHLKFNA